MHISPKRPSITSPDASSSCHPSFADDALQLCNQCADMALPLQGITRVCRLLISCQPCKCISHVLMPERPHLHQPPATECHTAVHQCWCKLDAHSCHKAPKCTGTCHDGHQSMSSSLTVFSSNLCATYRQPDRTMASIHALHQRTGFLHVTMMRTSAPMSRRIAAASASARNRPRRSTAATPSSRASISRYCASARLRSAVHDQQLHPGKEHPYTKFHD